MKDKDYIDSFRDFINEENTVDTIKLDVPLFIRLLEYAREEAETDMDLHDLAEEAIKLSLQGKTLTMQDYITLVKKEIKELFGFRKKKDSYGIDPKRDKISFDSNLEKIIEKNPWAFAVGGSEFQYSREMEDLAKMIADEKGGEVEGYGFTKDGEIMVATNGVDYIIDRQGNIKDEKPSFT